MKIEYSRIYDKVCAKDLLGGQVGQFQDNKIYDCVKGTES